METREPVITSGITHYHFLSDSDVKSLKEYLVIHEQDIALGMNDFGSLRKIFKSLLEREPKEINA